MKTAGLVIGAFVAFTFIIWGALIVHAQHVSANWDIGFEAIGGLLVAGGLTFFWAAHRKS